MRLLDSSRFVTISSLTGVTSPSAANIEAESNVTACRDEDDKKKKKVQAESAYAEISLSVSVEDHRTANSAECCAFLEVEKKTVDTT